MLPEDGLIAGQTTSDSDAFEVGPFKRVLTAREAVLARGRENDIRSGCSWSLRKCS